MPLPSGGRHLDPAGRVAANRNVLAGLEQGR